MSPVVCPVAHSAAHNPEAPALEQGSTRWNYQQLDSMIEQRVQQIRHIGLRARNRVALRAELDWQQVVLFWALLRHGTVACLISPRLPPKAATAAAAMVQATPWEVLDAMANSGARGSSRVEDAASSGSAGASPSPRTILEPPLARDGYRSTETFPEAAVSANLPPDASTILFSSGTSATPKAIVHTQSAHRASAHGANENIPLRPGDRWLLSLPWSHVSGLGILFRCALAGATVVIPNRQNALADDIARLGMTHVSLVPTQLKRVLSDSASPPNQLRACLLGGAALPPRLVQQAADHGWPIHTTYGLTEMGSQVTTTAPGATAGELQTSGHVLPGRELKIGLENEILVRGDTLFQGYCRPHHLERPLDEAGWFHTGDRGELTRDGLLRVWGRCDQMFISGGENIYPEEIEQALLGLGPILQSVVVAVTDAEYGHRPVAFVQCTEFEPAQWQRQLAEQLPRFKIPKLYLPWPEPTDTMRIKPSRQELQQLAQRYVETGGQPTSPRSSTEP